MKKKPKLDESDFYCHICGTCGYIGCCGIRDFIEKHVRGKTNCLNEASMLDEIITTIEDSEYYKINHEHEKDSKIQTKP